MGTPGTENHHRHGPFPASADKLPQSRHPEDKRCANVFVLSRRSELGKSPVPCQKPRGKPLAFVLTAAISITGTLLLCAKIEFGSEEFVLPDVNLALRKID